MSNKDSNAYPPFEFVAAGARPRALVSKVARRRRRASSWDAIVHPNNIGLDMVMYRAGEGPKPTTAPKPVPRAGPSPLPSPGPKSHEGTDAIPMDYFDKACMSPSPDSITEDLGRCLGSDCLCRACCRALAGLPPVDPDVTAEEKALEEATREARAARLSHHSENFEAGVAAAAELMREAAAAEAAAAEAARLEMEAQQAMADSVCLDEDDDENYENDDVSVTLDYTINLDEEMLALDDDIRATTVPSHADTTKRCSNSSTNNRRSSSNSSAEDGGYDCSIDDDDNDSVGSHSSTSSASTVSGNKKTRPRRSVRRATRHSARPSRPSSKPAPKRHSSRAPLKDAAMATTAGGGGDATNAEQAGDASDGDCAVDGRRCSGSGNELDLPDDESSSSYSPNKQLFTDPVPSGLAPLVEAENEHPTPAKPSEAAAAAAAEARSALCDALHSATDASVNSNNSGHKDEVGNTARSTAGASSPSSRPPASVPPPSPASGTRPKPSHPSSSSSTTAISSHRRSLLGKPMGTSMDSVLGSNSSSGSAIANDGMSQGNTNGGGDGKGDGPDGNPSSRAPSPLVRVVYSVALSPDPKDMPTTTAATTDAAAKASTGTGASYNVTLDDDDDDINLYGESGYEAPDASGSLVKSPATKAHSSHGSANSSSTASNTSAGGGSGGNSIHFSRQSAVGSVSTAQARKSLVQQRKDLDTRRQLRLAGGTSLDSVLGPSSSLSPSSFSSFDKSPASKPKPSTHLQRSPALNNTGPSGRRSAPACLITEQRESETGAAREGESSSGPGDSTQTQEMQQPKEEGWVPLVTIPVDASEESPPCLIPESRPPKDSLDLVATTTASTSAATFAATPGSTSATAALPRRPAPSRPRPRTAPLLETHKFFNSPEDGDQVPASNEENGHTSCNGGQEKAGSSSSSNSNVFVSISKDERLESSEAGNDDSAPMPSEPRPARLLSPDSVMFDDEEDDNFDESNITAAKRAPSTAASSMQRTTAEQAQPAVGSAATATATEPAAPTPISAVKPVMVKRPQPSRPAAFAEPALQRQNATVA